MRRTDPLRLPARDRLGAGASAVRWSRDLKSWTCIQLAVVTLVLLASPVAAAQGGLSVTPPEVSGLARVGEALKATEGSWTPTGATPATASYQWLRCDAAGKACEAIAGAVDRNSYTINAADMDQRCESG